MVATLPSLFNEMCLTFSTGLDPEPVALGTRPAFERDWNEWLTHIFPDYLYFDADGNAIFGAHHAEFWQWVWRIQAGQSPPEQFVGIWSRGGAKSTSVEMACAALGALGKRRYVLYVSSRQDQADDHVLNIATMLESPQMASWYPAMADRKVGKFGNARGWRRNRLWTRSGFIVDAIGLDVAARGVKLEGQRPDLIVLDDIDKESDSTEATAKKEKRITQAILPAGSRDVAIIAIQNLILQGGIFDRLQATDETRATYLANRHVSGPIPAIRDLEYTEAEGRVTITGGEPTWAGQDLTVCQQQINDWGIDAFLAEAQHNPRARGEKIVKREWFTNQNRYSIHDERLLSTVAARFMSWDTAESTADGSAYSAVTVGDLVPYRGGYAILVREVWRDRVEFAALLDAMEMIGRRWGFHERTPTRMEGCIVEYASSGRQVVQLARANVTTLRLQAPDWLRDLIRPFTPKIPKDDRGRHAARFIRAGRVWLPEPDPALPWLPAFEQELYTVPQTTYRDMTDSLFQSILALQAWLAEPGDATIERSAA